MEYVVLGIVFFILMTLYSSYSSLIDLKNGSKSALSTIDIQLRQRLDSIPNILKLAGRHLTHEKELFTQVAALREGAQTAEQKALQTGSAKDVEEMFSAQGVLDKAMGALSVKIEAYPESKSDITLVHAMEDLKDVEDNIAGARRLYNSAVMSLNIKVEKFPSSIVSGFAKAEIMPFYEDQDKGAINKTINASDYI